jgi:hypothetical protein
MTNSWNSLEGVTLAERFQLQTLVSENGNIACFFARVGGASQPWGWLWLSIGDGGGIDPQLRRWQTVASLNHPNLLQAWETGRGDRGDTSMAYLLTEAADENLAAVLRERPLNQLEALQAVLAVARALTYLHSSRLVHGAVEPASIFAVNDQIKLSTATIAAAPEGSDGTFPAATDMRALGACVHEMFTQTREVDLDRLSAIPQPFRDIIRGCCAENPAERWTAQRIVTLLDGPAEPATPPMKPAEPAPLIPAPPEPEAAAEPIRRKRVPNSVIALVSAGTLALVFLVILFGRREEPAAVPPARVAVPPAPIAVPPAKVIPKPSPMPPPTPVNTAPAVRRAAPKELAQARIWRVVTYTYSRAEDAARMVADINRRFPHLRAERFFPNDSSPPYYVAIGGRMTRNEAERLRERAISSGLPSDTFVRNFK